jgi:hypothetical protein
MFARGGGAQLRGHGDGAVHVSGVKRCASVWACPICGPAIREQRAREIDAAGAEWIKRGGTLVFVSATVSHRLGDHLSDVFDLVQSAWSATFRFGRNRPAWYRGQVRVAEVTHGRNGWHPHIHAAIFVHGRPADAVMRVRSALASRWSDAVHSLGGSTDVTSARSPGFDVRAVTDTEGLAQYVCKVSDGWGLGLELARGDLKRNRGKGSTPHELLTRAIDGDYRSASLWAVYERATHGRRFTMWSPGLKAELGVEELSDIDAAAVDPSSTVLTVTAFVPARRWNRYARTGEAAEIINAVSLIASGNSPPSVWRWPRSWLLSVSPSSRLPRSA